MANLNTTYKIRERTGNPAHPSIEAVYDRLLERVRMPRDDHPDAHLDETVASLVGRYGEDTVRKAVHLILVEGIPFRTTAAMLDMPPFDGVCIGTVANHVLRELNADAE
jgi:hypothetical protein